MAAKVIINFIAKALFKKKGAIANNKAVDFSANALEQRLKNLGIDPNAIKSENELNQILSYVKQAEDQAFSQRFGDMLAGSKFDKPADVLDMTGKKINPRSKIMGGQQSETEAEILARINKENKKGIAGIKNRQLTKDEYQDFLDEIGGEDQLEAYNFDGTVGDAKRIVKEQKDYMSQMEMEFRKGKLDPEPGSYTPQRKKFLEQKYEEMQMSGDNRLMTQDEIEELSTFDLQTDMDKAVEKFKKKDAKEKKIIKDFDPGDRDPSAKGGRAGFSEGTPDKKGILDMFDVQAAGSKSGKRQIMGAPGGITADRESIDAIVKADIPISQKIDLLAKYQYGKGRTRIEKDNQEIFMDEGGFKSRDIGFGFNKDGDGIGGTLMYNMETGDPEFNIGFKKRFAEGGRIGYKDGPDVPGRRKFMKIMGGLATIPFVGKFFKGAKTAAPAVEKAAEVVGQAPSYFFDLVTKIKMFGKPGISIGPRQNTMNYKNYELMEDVSTGDLRITKQKGDPEFNYEEEVMEYRKGQRTEDGVIPDEYGEATIRPDMDGKMKDFEDGIEPDSIKEIIKEATKEAPSIKKADGGIAMMLGE